MRKAVLITGCILLLVIAAGVLLLSNGYLKLNNPSLARYPVRGLDVSAHQKGIDWAAVQKHGFHFVFIKATEGMDFKDRYFARNWAQAGEIGLRRGAYHFFTFRSPGLEQARNYMATVPMDPDALPPVVDIEFGGNSKTVPDRETFHRELQDFITAVEAHYGKKPILYVTHSAYKRFIDGAFAGYPIWINDIIKFPRLKGQRAWTFWQYTTRARLEGFATFVDVNVFRGDLHQFEQAFPVRAAKMGPVMQASADTVHQEPGSQGHGAGQPKTWPETFITHYGPLVTVQFGHTIHWPEDYAFVRWFYWDVDGDGEPERVVRLGGAEPMDNPLPRCPAAEFWPQTRAGAGTDQGTGYDECCWDDGQPWQVYIEEKSGAVTHVFADYVQLARFYLVVREEEPRLSIVIERSETEKAVYEVRYSDPGAFRVTRTTQAPGGTIIGRDGNSLP